MLIGCGWAQAVQAAQETAAVGAWTTYHGAVPPADPLASLRHAVAAARAARDRSRAERKEAEEHLERHEEALARAERLLLKAQRAARPRVPAAVARSESRPSFAIADRRGPRGRQPRQAAQPGAGGLLPTSVEVTHGAHRRRIALAAGGAYRFDPLNPRRRKDRGRTGRLLSWSIDGTSAALRWDDDGSVGEIALGDLVAIDPVSSRRRGRRKGS
jgi:hypothetical protein